MKWKVKKKNFVEICETNELKYIGIENEYEWIVQYKYILLSSKQKLHKKKLNKRLSNEIYYNKIR